MGIEDKNRVKGTRCKLATAGKKNIVLLQPKLINKMEKWRKSE